VETRRFSSEITGFVDDDLWQAAVERDALYDGFFVFAVRTTGVYCRPSCPARRPKRENAVFFDRLEAAERTGFRTCKRCQPQDPAAPDSCVALAWLACDLIEANAEDPPTLAKLGSPLYVSPHHLQRTFKHIVGVTPHQYAEAHCAARLKVCLKEGEPVTYALYEAGYGSSSRFYEGASERFGMMPATYRKGGRGMRIGYTVVGCPLGLLLVGATDKGVCAVYLGDSEELESELGNEYPAAEIRCDDSAFGPWVDTLLRRLDGTQPHADLPLDVRATAFQRRVWEELVAIPRGETRTYGEISHGEASLSRFGPLRRSVSLAFE